MTVIIPLALGEYSEQRQHMLGNTGALLRAGMEDSNNAGTENT